MNFMCSELERDMKKIPAGSRRFPDGAPAGSPCDGCPYWRGIGCLACYRDILKRYRAGR